MPYARKDILTWQKGMYYHISPQEYIKFLFQYLKSRDLPDDVKKFLDDLEK